MCLNAVLESPKARIENAMQVIENTIIRKIDHSYFAFGNNEFNQINSSEMKKCLPEKINL